MNHCVKSVRSRSCSGPHFSRISRHSDFKSECEKMRENSDQNNSKYGHFLRSEWCSSFSKIFTVTAKSRYFCKKAPLEMFHLVFLKTAIRKTLEKFWKTSVIHFFIHKVTFVNFEKNKIPCRNLNGSLEIFTLLKLLGQKKF